MIAAATRFVRAEFLLWCALLLFGAGIGWFLRGREERRKRHDATVGDLRERVP